MDPNRLAPTAGSLAGPVLFADVIWILPLVALLFLGIFALLVVRALARTAAQAARKAPGPLDWIGVRLAVDGFWLDAPDLPVGTTVRYRCRVEGAPTTGLIALTRGLKGTFVYTGGNPAEVEVVEVVPPPAATTSTGVDVSGPASDDALDRHDSPPSSSSDSFRGYPSAY